MSLSVLEGDPLPLRCADEDGNSRDSGISSSRVTPEPESHSETVLTAIRYEETSEMCDKDWDPTVLYGGLISDQERLDGERLQKFQFTRRIPFSDCKNTSNSSQGSIKSNPRSSKHRLPESPLTSFGTIPPPRLLTASIFNDDEEEMSSVQLDQISELDVCLSSARYSSAARSQPVLRRTLSEYSELPSRKRSIENVAENDLKRIKNSATPTVFDDINLDDSVFTNDDCSPNISSVWNSSSCHLPKVSRAISCGVLEMGEHHPVPSPTLPRMMQVHYSLPYVEKPQKESSAFRSISGETLANELRNLGEDGFREKYTLVDCRYPYEYDGGHVMTAINVHDQNVLEDLFFPSDMEAPIRRRIPIFYCEYSQKRGPGMAHHLRSLDRRRNELNYPQVDYEEIYLLDHGYSRFWKDGPHTDLCEPRAYVAMLEPTHQKKLSTYKWHKSRSTYNLSRAEAGGGVVRSRRLNFARHQSLMQINQRDDDSPVHGTPTFARTRSTLNFEMFTTTSQPSLEERELTQKKTKSPVAVRLNFDRVDSSPDNSTTE